MKTIRLNAPSHILYPQSDDLPPKKIQGKAIILLIPEDAPIVICEVNHTSTEIRLGSNKFLVEGDYQSIAETIIGEDQ